MPTTDTEQLLREALGTILAADATLVGLCGGRVIDRVSPGPAVAVPCVAYEVVTYLQASGEALVRLTGIADEANGDAKARALLEAAVAALTWTAFNAQGVDAVISAGTRQNVDEAGDVRDWLDGTPHLRQADELVPLLVLQ